jgi:hypothetical protein
LEDDNINLIIDEVINYLSSAPNDKQFEFLHKIPLLMTKYATRLIDMLIYRDATYLKPQIKKTEILAMGEVLRFTSYIKGYVKPYLNSIDWNKYFTYPNYYAIAIMESLEVYTILWQSNYMNFASGRSIDIVYKDFNGSIKGFQILNPDEARREDKLYPMFELDNQLYYNPDLQYSYEFHNLVRQKRRILYPNDNIVVDRLIYNCVDNPKNSLMRFMNF